MSPRARRHLLLAIAYLASVGASCLHSLLDVETQCSECELRLERGPWLASSCGGSTPCEDPTHHHHRTHGHDHGQCPACQGKLHGIEPSLERRDLAVLTAVTSCPSRQAGSLGCAFARTPPARGPPHLS